jgi:hypothetical protein
MFNLATLKKVSAVVIGATLMTLGAEKMASAAVITLDFEGLQNFEAVNNFYAGGTGGNGSSSGQDYGISFSTDSLAIIDSDAAGGAGNFANEPTADTVLFFTANTAVMNVANGFTDGFSFFYSSNQTTTINVYDGLNKTGNILASLSLPGLPLGTVGGDPTGLFDVWDNIGVSFAGTARSVDFGGVAAQVGFDNITIGSAVAGLTGGEQSTQSVPESSPVLGLLAFGMLGLATRKTKSVD